MSLNKEEDSGHHLLQLRAEESRCLSRVVLENGSDSVEHSSELEALSESDEIGEPDGQHLLSQGLSFEHLEREL